MIQLPYIPSTAVVFYLYRANKRDEGENVGRGYTLRSQRGLTYCNTKGSFGELTAALRGRSYSTLE